VQALFEFSQSDVFQSFWNDLVDLGSEIQDDIVGVTIDFHPIWWRLATLWHYSGGVNYSPELPFSSAMLNGPLLPGPDSRWSSGAWENLCKTNNKKPNPFLVRICFRADGESEHKEALVDFAQQRSFFCVVIERPLATAASSFDGGRHLTADASGTIGVFLRDKNTLGVYGVTCGHVAQTPNTAVNLDDSTGVTHVGAGYVSHSSFSSLQPLNLGQSCNRSSTVVGMDVDAALIRLGDSHQALRTQAWGGVVDEILDRSRFGVGDSVEMCGSVSKHNSYFIGPYDAVYKVLFQNGNIHCFQHMFEINRHALTSSWTPPILAIKPVQGDSGASICRANSAGNVSYCGTLVAADGTNGYACFAEAVLAWAGNRGLNLAPL
jgi:hypothetical protein